jgi:hypothetical protein
MNKKNNKNFNYIFWFFFFIIIIVPISLSYKNITDFQFNLTVLPSQLNAPTSVLNDLSNENPSEYLFTLPISFFFTIPLILFGLLNFYKSYEVLLFLFLFLFSFISLFFNSDLLYLLLIAKIITPILTLIGLEMYFKKKLLFNKKKDALQILKKLNHKFILIFTIVFFISIISPIYLDNPHGWLINKISIYDYLQYFPLVFILLLGMFAANNQRYLFLLVFILSFYFYGSTHNLTFAILHLLFGAYYILNLLICPKKKNLVNLTKIFIICLFFIIFIYPFFITTFYSEFINLDFANSLHSRFDMIYNFYSNVHFLDFLTPIRINSYSTSKYHHNEITVIIDAIGIFGAFLFYLVFLKRIWFSIKYYPEISLAISLVCFLSGLVVTANLHPYTSIIISFIVSYYYVLSKFQSKNSFD